MSKGISVNQQLVYRYTHSEAAGNAADNRTCGSAGTWTKKGSDGGPGGSPCSCAANRSSGLADYHLC
jgi:hypothetical protein